jgi:ABC-type phosphate transport system auxiliary subunit
MPEQEQQQLQTEVDQPQLLRLSVNYLQKYAQESYGIAKSWSPAIIQSQLDTLETSSAVNALAAKVDEASQPVINYVDERLQALELEKNLAGLKEKVETRATSIKEQATGLKDQALQVTGDLKSNIETRATAIKTEVETRATSIKEQATGLKDQALQVTGDLKSNIETRATAIKTEVVKQTEPIVTRVTEKVEAVKSKANEWKDLRGDLSKKAVQRLEAGLSTVKEFSSEQSKAFLHVDLIQYAAEVIDNAQTTVKPTFTALNEKVAAGILTVTQSVAKVQDLAIEKSKLGLEQAEAFRAELRVRLAAAITASRDLSNHSAEYVLQRYRQLSALDRQQIQASVNESIQYILTAPSLFAKLTDRFDKLGTEITSMSAVEHINRLLSSLQVVFTRKTQPPASPSEEETAASHVAPATDSEASTEAKEEKTETKE